MVFTPIFISLRIALDPLAPDEVTCDRYPNPVYRMSGCEIESYQLQTIVFDSVSHVNDCY